MWASPDEVLVRYVELVGTFHTSPPFGIQPSTYAGTGVQVFDMRTGNVIAEGGG